jgi:hypothetical protein
VERVEAIDRDALRREAYCTVEERVAVLGDRLKGASPEQRHVRKDADRVEIGDVAHRAGWLEPIVLLERGDRVGDPRRQRAAALALRALVVHDGGHKFGVSLRCGGRHPQLATSARHEVVVERVLSEAEAHRADAFELVQVLRISAAFQARP